MEDLGVKQSDLFPRNCGLCEQGGGLVKQLDKDRETRAAVLTFVIWAQTTEHLAAALRIEKEINS